MTTVELTPDEVAAWADVPEGGTFWLVREPSYDLRCDNCGGSASLPLERRCENHLAKPTPPAEFVQACAPCEVCTGTRHLHPAVSGDLHPMPCQVCRIELVGPCPTCLGKTGWHGRDVPRTGVHNADRWFPCNRCRADHYSAPTGTVILGHAYAVGQPLPIMTPSSHPISTIDHLCFDRTLIVNVHDDVEVDFTATLAHYGPPESLVGKWAVELRRA